ncbi:MAG: putative metal-binding motif-containing protein [Myxococcales bacterium]|nr:putative metal-binding motif-containing protein [Myxococcales bacterium]
MRPLRLLALLTAGLLSCASPTQTGAAFRITIGLGEGVTSRCVLLEVKDPSTGAVLKTSRGAPITNRLAILAAVFRDDLPETISLQAIGFSDDACTSAMRTVPAEVSELLQETFPALGVKDLPLTLKRDLSMSVDIDNDGAPEGVDCNDRDPQVRPGLVEVCTDGKDNNCDDLSDCGDGTCTGKQCKQAGSVCTATPACVEVTCSDALDNDSDGTVDCGDSDCDGKACAGGGTCAAGSCTNATNEQMLCNDGVDNDNDGLTDCVDPDCNLQPCRDALACNVGELCTNGACSGGMPAVCAQSANTCLAPTGACREPDGGCDFTPRATTVGCDDGQACTISDACDGDGGCTGTAKECLTPPLGPCWESQGTCNEANDGGCTYDVAVGRLSCSDTDDCTVNDACLEDGGCLGAPLDCTNAIPPDECQVSAGPTCVAGACPFMPRMGSCDGGTCAGGVCVPMVMMDAGTVDSGVADGGSTPADAGPVDGGASSDAGAIDAGPSFIQPSNVTLADINAVPSLAHFNVTCSSILNLNPVSIRSTTSCPAPTLPDFTVVSQTNGPTLVLFVMDRFTIASSVTLRVNRGPMGTTGGRAAVFAVKGDATINGTLDVSVQDGAINGTYVLESGAGGEGSFCPTSTVGVALGSRSGGGHGGAFGGASGSGGRGGDNGGAGAAGRAAGGTEALMPLRGGCPGSRGGNAAASRYGRAGGAVQLWVRGLLVINGAILASGGRGFASQEEGGGGGGGGSGGGILVEATTLNLGASAILAANGGSGAEGSSLGDGRNGQNGTVGVSTAPGGTGANVCGGFGGRGAARAGGSTSGQDGNSDCFNLGGGGGGGGSAGRIRLNTLNPCAITMGARISPQPTSMLASCSL